MVHADDQQMHFGKPNQMVSKQTHQQFALLKEERDVYPQQSFAAMDEMPMVNQNTGLGVGTTHSYQDKETLREVSLLDNTTTFLVKRGVLDSESAEF